MLEIVLGWVSSLYVEGSVGLGMVGIVVMLGMDSVDMYMVGRVDVVGIVGMVGMDMCTRWKSVGGGVDGCSCARSFFCRPPTPPKQWRKDFLVPFLWDSYWCSRLHLETVAVHFGKTFTTLLLPTMDIGQYPLLPSI